jgi:hypothetical protein
LLALQYGLAFERVGDVQDGGPVTNYQLPGLGAQRQERG